MNTETPQRLANTQEELHLLGSDLMRGNGPRVVSAWRHMQEATTPGRWLKAEFHNRLFDLIVGDIQSHRAGDHRGQLDIAAWVCRPYINLVKSYGAEQWPLVALREYLRQLGKPAGMAEEVWERELRAYKDEKEFFSGRPWNAAR